MNVLVLTQFYPPESCAASSRTQAVTKALVDAGHQVHVITAHPSFPAGTFPQGCRPWRFAAEVRDGVNILRVPTYASPRLRGRDRLFNWASVSLGATISALAVRRRIDCVYVTCPPVTLALPALAVAKARRCPLFVDVRDSYPDVAVKMGAWREDSLLTRTVARVVRRLYGAADAVACVTQTVANEVRDRGADPAKILIAPNGFDAVEPSTRAPFSRDGDDFVVAFAGNIGVATGVDVIIDAAQRVSDLKHVRFVLAGGGSAFEEIRLRRDRYGLENTSLLGPLDRPVALAVLRDADLCVVPLKRGIHDSLPTKIFDSLYVGCPVLVSGDGEAGDFASRSGGGWSVAAEDPDALAQAIRKAAADREACRRAGATGRDYVRANWSRSRGVSAIVERIATIRN
ncbi:MAG TPA: glycosyltransferase family 4 protein [Candidatus Baltobacteraceae bacterium]|nr:glycosyltransferase family 4 protein [Candidatus Baltobacteraceae bacterium]